MRLAALLIFTFPGAPCVYYGDEIGMVGGPDPACRGAFPWDREHTWNNELLAAFSSLARLRQREDSPAAWQLPDSPARALPDSTSTRSSVNTGLRTAFLIAAELR